MRLALRSFVTLLLGLFGCSLTLPLAAAPEAVELLYQKHCGECHGPGRLGAMGPALLPENLKRLRKPSAMETIKKGRAATQMPPFEAVLTDEQVDALIAYIYTPLKETPVWGEAEILASHVIHHPSETLSDKPVFEADMMNLFIVVELGDHHATILDGDKMEPIHRFKTRLNLHGGPKYSPQGRYIYLASRDGWISKFDIYNLKVVAEVRAGINTRNLAVSADGRTVMVANYLPHTLVAFDAEDLSLLKVIPVVDKDGNSSRVSAVYTAKPRSSFIAALKDLKEVWEINYEIEPPAGFGAWVHDYRKDSGDGDTRSRFPVRMIPVNNYLDDFFFDQDYILLIGASRDGYSEVVDLDASRVIAKPNLPGMPHLASGITWEYQGRTIMATPNLRENSISIIDMQSWELIKKIPTHGPGFFMRSHENTPYAWVDVFFGKHRDEVHVIDKRTLEIVKTLKPEPGKTAAHVEFTKDGRYALLSIWDQDGALVIYDAASFEEIKRLPMVKPSGKYNVWNKTRLSAGTSH